MDKTLLITFGIIFCCFFISYIWYSALDTQFSQSEETHPLRHNTILPILIPATLGILALYLFLPPQYDQIYDITSLQISIIIAGSFVTFLGFSHSQKYGLLCLTLSGIVNIVVLPENFMFFSGYFPFWIDRLLLLPLWIGFSYGYKYTNGLDGLFPTQASFPLIGIIILSFIGALPYFVGSMSGIILAGITALIGIRHV